MESKLTEIIIFSTYYFLYINGYSCISSRKKEQSERHFDISTQIRKSANGKLQTS